MSSTNPEPPLQENNRYKSLSRNDYDALAISLAVAMVKNTPPGLSVQEYRQTLLSRNVKSQLSSFGNRSTQNRSTTPTSDFGSNSKIGSSKLGRTFTGLNSALSSPSLSVNEKRMRSVVQRSFGELTEAAQKRPCRSFQKALSNMPPPSSLSIYGSDEVATSLSSFPSTSSSDMATMPAMTQNWNESNLPCTPVSQDRLQQLLQSQPSQISQISQSSQPPKHTQAYQRQSQECQRFISSQGSEAVPAQESERWPNHVINSDISKAVREFEAKLADKDLEILAMKAVYSQELEKLRMLQRRTTASTPSTVLEESPGHTSDPPELAMEKIQKGDLPHFVHENVKMAFVLLKNVSILLHSRSPSQLLPPEPGELDESGNSIDKATSQARQLSRQYHLQQTILGACIQILQSTTESIVSLVQSATGDHLQGTYNKERHSSFGHQWLERLNLYRKFVGIVLEHCDRGNTWLQQAPTGLLVEEFETLGTCLEDSWMVLLGMLPALYQLENSKDKDDDLGSTNKNDTNYCADLISMLVSLYLFLPFGPIVNSRSSNHLDNCEGAGPAAAASSSAPLPPLPSSILKRKETDNVDSMTGMESRPKFVKPQELNNQQTLPRSHHHNHHHNHRQRIQLLLSNTVLKVLVTSLHHLPAAEAERECGWITVLLERMWFEPSDQQCRDQQPRQQGESFRVFDHELMKSVARSMDHILVNALTPPSATLSPSFRLEPHSWLSDRIMALCAIYVAAPDQMTGK